MDHYKALGLGRTASKEEIKAAFRRCALEFHPDRHSLSAADVRDRAAARFRQASEAYEVLMDDVRRANYDRGPRGPFGGGGRGGYYSSGYRGYGYGGGDGGWAGYGGASARASSPGGMGVEWEAAFRYLTSRRFAMNVLLASALLGGTVVIQRSGEAIWKMNNSGKSFDEVIETIEKSKVKKDNG